MQLLIVLCAVIAVSQAGYLAGGLAAYGAPGLVAGAYGAHGVVAAPAAVAAPGLLAGAYGAHGLLAGAYGAPGLLAGHAAIAAPAVAYAAPHVVPAAAHPASTLSAGGPAGYTALSPAGTPIETPAVQAGRVIDAVAHVNAKTHAYLG
ncbi:cuticle protein 18.7-like [Anabrus simplex]|uniref:cuticle protein 18.7-like n=1 Tax=Anabrus simplex TaxID=316456 RepID=UPI0034DD695E